VGETIRSAPTRTAWRGPLPHGHAAWFEFHNSGSWLDRAPGETRIQLDYSGLTTLYDPMFTSLTEARHGKPCDAHHPGGMSAKGLQRVCDVLDEVLARGP